MLYRSARQIGITCESRIALIVSGQADGVISYLGHAARCAMSLGLNRSEIVCSDGVVNMRLCLTFWTTFILERISTTMTGRPTAIPDSEVDTPYPQDVPSTFGEPDVEYAYIRAMIAVCKVGHDVMSINYLPCNSNNAPGPEEISKMVNISSTQLACLARTLPHYLCFMDRDSVIGTTTQEVQRTFLGAKYHMVQILTYRPAQVFGSLFTSPSLAQEDIGEAIDLAEYTSLAVDAAKQIIQLTHDAAFIRCPQLAHDGNMVVRIHPT
jgi:hypothetical protein